MLIDTLCAVTGASVHEARNMAMVFVACMLTLIVGVFMWEAKRFRP